MATHEIVRPSELLAQLARDYHRVHQDHAREARNSSARRRLAAEMARTADRFERVLEHWAAAEDQELRDIWRKHLYEGKPRPEGPTVEPPCLFKGETEAGARLEIRPAADAGYDLLIEGSRIEHSAIPWHLDPEASAPFLTGQYSCRRELFDAPDEAVRALGRFVATPESLPPWRWAAELYQDGLIDSEFALTPRGRRGLALVEPAAPGPQRASYCVIAADAGRARILTLDAGSSPGESTPRSLVEVGDLANPARRTRDRDLFSDTRPGLRQEGAHGPRHAVDDRREHQRHESDKRFAELVAELAEAAWRAHPGCHVVLVAPPRMLGSLRPAIARRRSGAGAPDIDELDRDLSRLSPPALHDALAQAGLLPARGRAHVGPAGA